MEYMSQLTVPSMPQWSDLSAYLAGGALIVLGAAMLVWGRWLGRPLMMLACGAAGYFVASIQLTIPFFPQPVRQLVFIFVLLCFGFVFERLVWAMLALALGAVLTAAWRMGVALAASVPETPADFQALAGSWWTMLVAFVGGQVQKPDVALVMAASTAALVIVLASIFCPRFIRVVMTSVLGAMLLGAGLVLSVCQALPWAWAQLWLRAPLALAAVAGLALLGAGLQLYAMARRDRIERQKEQERQAATAEQAAAEKRKPTTS